MTISRGKWLAVFLLLCILLGYFALSIGLLDETIIARNRSAMLSRVEVASNDSPPDIEFLIKALTSTDWFVAGVAADRLGQLWQSGEITSEQADIVVRSLFEALASGGHWWRFGWDNEDPEFAQFRGAVIEAVSKFGINALTPLSGAMNSDSPFEREAACWIAGNMLDTGLSQEFTSANLGITERLESLADSDPNEGVRAACESINR